MAKIIKQNYFVTRKSKAIAVEGEAPTALPMEGATRAPLIDSFGRRIQKLRISLTDQCNFRCLYCMPAEGVPVLPKQHHLNNKALIRFVTVISQMGVSKIRLTGGEPLLRADLIPLVEELAKIPEVQDISITTNASRLKKMAFPLKKAGLHRINVSLDSLDAIRFQQITRSSQFEQVMEGLEEALRLNFPMKINLVLIKGMNESEIFSFVELALKYSIAVRFLEFMPLCGSAWKPELVYPVGEVRRLLEEKYSLLEEERGDDPAQTFIVREGKRMGRVGFIGPLSEPFCDACSRMRLTVDGKIQACLFSHQQFSIKALLDEGASDEELENAIREAIWKKSRGSQYAKIQNTSEESTYLRAYEGQEKQNPYIHNIGG